MASHESHNHRVEILRPSTRTPSEFRIHEMLQQTYHERQRYHDELETQVSLINNRIEDSENRLNNRIQELQHQLGHQPRGIMVLKRRNEALQEALTTEQDKIKFFMRDKEKDRNRIRSLEDELGQSMNQLNVLQKEQIHLKNIIVDTKGDKNEPTVAELTQAFTSVYAHIQKLCRKVNVQSTATINESTPVDVQAFYDDVWPRYQGNVTVRRWALCTKLFETLKLAVFDEPCFGLCGDIEVQLANLEKRLWLETSIEHRSEVLDWRRLTIECVKALGSEMSGNPAWAKKWQAMWLLIQPILDDSKKVRQQVTDELETLYKKASGLALRMRDSRSVHSVDVMERGRRINCLDEDDLMVEGCEGRDLDEEQVVGSTVAYTLFGALSRYDYGLGRRVVLAKARVVVEKIDVEIAN